MHTLIIFGEKKGEIAQEYLQYDVEENIIPTVERLPYQRGYGYSIVTGNIHGDLKADAIIEVAFTSIDDMERAVNSAQKAELVESCNKVFKEDSLRILSTHQV
ncbi:MAG: hypothetical protein GF315_11030 [candidate division Zixibacteria bacterium]|nr:hypothetical protein [candidate division Zixibacteria bacterium]